MLKSAYYNLVAAALMYQSPSPRADVMAVGIGGCKLKGNLLLHMVFALSASGMIGSFVRGAFSSGKLPQPTPSHLYLSCTCRGLVNCNRRTPGRNSQRESGAT